MSPSLSSLLPAVRDIVLRASIAVQAIQDAPDFTVSSKGEAGPLTSADLMADKIIRNDLVRLDPEAGLLSEETGDDPARLEKSRVWIIDPIDGTREFVNRIPEYSVSVGLSVQGRPALGVVSMPARNLIVSGGPGLGLMLDYYELRPPGMPGPDENASRPESLVELPGYGDFLELDGGANLPREETPRIVVRRERIHGRAPSEPGEPPLALVSRSEKKKGKFEGMERDYRISPGGSIARKLAQVALGEGDLNFSLYPKNEWDICGGIALVLSHPDYRVLDLENFQPHEFNRRDTRSYGLVAGPGDLVEGFTEYYRRRKLKLEKRYD